MTMKQLGLNAFRSSTTIVAMHSFPLSAYNENNVIIREDKHINLLG